jgi:Zn-dependent peptidase ImmA (M78 family)
MSSPSPAEERAMELLAETNTVQPPVPIEKIAASQGAQITYAAFDGEVSGVLYRESNRVLIAVNSTHAPTRQRFTIAHEVGHLLMHKGRPVVVDRLVRVNMNLRDGTSSKEEIEANAFAAELLMPRKLIASEIDRFLKRTRRVVPQELVDELAATFRVSPEAMSYRLENLGILDPNAGF